MGTTIKEVETLEGIIELCEEDPNNPYIYDISQEEIIWNRELTASSKNILERGIVVTCSLTFHTFDLRTAREKLGAAIAALRERDNCFYYQIIIEKGPFQLEAERTMREHRHHVDTSLDLYDPQLYSTVLQFRFQKQEEEELD